MFVGEPNRIILDREKPTVLPRSASGTYQRLKWKNASVYSFIALDSDVMILSILSSVYRGFLDDMGSGKYFLGNVNRGQSTYRHFALKGGR